MSFDKKEYDKKWYQANKENCYYCNSNDDIGIDRINSNKPYIIDNCVACCSMCNRMKNTYSQEEFINKCKLIANLH